MNFIPLGEGHSKIINHLSFIINDWAEQKGWNETPDSLDHKCAQIALMHSELSECLEFLRKKPIPFCGNCGSKEGYVSASLGNKFGCDKCGEHTAIPVAMDDHVPSLTGEAAELADVLIRIFHYCGQHNINLGEAVRLKHEYNINRPYRHGKNI